HASAYPSQRRPGRTRITVRHQHISWCHLDSLVHASRTASVCKSRSVFLRSYQSQTRSALSDVRRQSLLESFPSPSQPSLHRPQRHVRDLGNFLVRHLFQVAQYQRRPVRLGNFMQLFIHPSPHLRMHHTVEGRLTFVYQEIASAWALRLRRFFGFDRHLPGLVSKPPTPPIRSLMQCDPINPLLKAGFTVEMLHAPEDL